MSFSDFIQKNILSSLAKMGVVQPTPVQEQAIPVLLEGKDIVMVANTGTGKTLAYVLPILAKLQEDIKKPQAIIVTPTHELALQVHKVIENLVQGAGMPWVEPALVIGGASKKRQLEQLKQKPRIVVGSLGRLLDLHDEKKLTTHFVKTIVFDEADRLVSMADSQISMAKLLKTTLADRQVVMVTAFASGAFLEQVVPFTKAHQLVDVTNERKIPENIKHSYIQCETRDKTSMIRKVFHAEKKRHKQIKMLVFLNNNHGNGIDAIVEKLQFHAIPCSVIYGTAKKNDRRTALSDFREGRTNILISTDLSCRGLDIPGITHVVSFDVPEDKEIYLHRAGRCGRMGASGTSILFANTREVQFIKKIEKAFDIQVTENSVAYGRVHAEGAWE